MSPGASVTEREERLEYDHFGTSWVTENWIRPQLRRHDGGLRSLEARAHPSAIGWRTNEAAEWGDRDAHQIRLLAPARERALANTPHRGRVSPHGRPRSRSQADHEVELELAQPGGGRPARPRRGSDRPRYACRSPAADARCRLGAKVRGARAPAARRSQQVGIDAVEAQRESENPRVPRRSTRGRDGQVGVVGDRGANSPTRQLHPAVARRRCARLGPERWRSGPETCPAAQKRHRGRTRAKPRRGRGSRTHWHPGHVRLSLPGVPGWPPRHRTDARRRSAKRHDTQRRVRIRAYFVSVRACAWAL